jgi:hypothetical protein
MGLLLRIINPMGRKSEGRGLQKNNMSLVDKTPSFITKFCVS